MLRQFTGAVTKGWKGEGLLEVVVAISCNNKHRVGAGEREREKGVRGRVEEP